MGERGVKKLHMAQCMESLNNCVAEIPKADPKRLVKSAKLLYEKAEIYDCSKDEERAYVFYMKFFSVVKNIQESVDYCNNKKYYDGLLDPKATAKVITRAEILQKSLQRRYDFANSSIESVKVAEDTEIRRKEKKEKEEKEVKAVKTTGLAVTNGVLEEEGFIKCKKLYSLMTEQCSSYLILDTRSRDDFQQSHMTLPNVISVPQEILRPGLIAGKIGNELDEKYVSVWVSQRHLVDYLIMVDWETETLPPPTPLQVLSASMSQWDPGHHYRSRAWILQGGYDLWRLMYPMLTTNAMVQRPLSTTPSVNLQQEVSLHFEYPDLDMAFISSPNSSSQTSQSELDTAFIATPSPKPNIPDFADKYTDPSKTPAIPQFNRTLKPKVTEREIMDGQNNNSNNNSTFNVSDSSADNSPAKPSLGTKVNTWDTKDSNVNLDQQKSKHMYPLPDKTDNFPSVPSRSLKPKDLLENLAAKKSELDEEQELLEESMKIEKDTIKKMEEMEIASSQRERSQDKESVARLQETEDRIQEQLRRLQKASADMEERQKKLQAENEEMWKMVNQALANQLKNVNLTSSDTRQQDEQRREQEEHEHLRKQTEQRKALQEQVEEMRRERKEKERKMNEQAEKEKIIMEQKALEAEMERRKLEERKSRVDGDIRSSKTKGGETYTSRLRGSPRSSPVRGGSNLRRSHSAFNLAQQDDDDDDSDGSSGVMPNFDRNLKPLVAPLKRNVNAARHRNFDPKYGHVPVAKTGLKNLGNTCYMNSIIQCLSNTKPLAYYFDKGTYSNDINPNSKSRGDIAEEVGAVIRALHCGQFRSIAMWDLKAVVGRNHKPFQGYDQHDSHEFLVKLLDWIHDDLNERQGKRIPMTEQNHENCPHYIAAKRVLEELHDRDYSITSKLFQGLHRSRIDCGTCGHSSLTFEPFSVVSLSFPDSRKCTLKDLLNHYYKDSNIEYKCSKCKTMRNCVRKLDVWKLPPLLILHLNRFEHDVLMKKKQNYVDFPIDNLDLTKYVPLTDKYTKFDLYAVSNHYGTMDGGHYTAFCKSPDHKVWYKYDDHEVYEHTSIRSPAAYLLFYQASNYNISSINFG